MEARSAPQVSIASWDRMVMPQQEIRATLLYLAHKTGKQISFRKYNGVPRYSEQVIDVAVCTDISGRCIEHLSISGETIDLGEPGIVIPADIPQGHLIVDDEGMPLACIDHNVVIILGEITRCYGQGPAKVLSYIIERAERLLDFEVGEMLEEERSRLGSTFQSFHNAALQARVVQKQETLRQLEYEAQDHYNKLVQVERDLPMSRQELADLQTSARKPSRNRIKQQASALAALVESAEYQEITPRPDGSFYAVSGSITIEHNDWLFQMGRYEVEINNTGSLLINSLDDTDGDGYPHPHIDSSGKPCLGNISPDLAKAIGRMRMAEALSLIQAFLSSYNPEGAYVKIRSFDPNYAGDDDDDPCENCDDHHTPYCIMGCGQNDGYFHCGDCSEYRTVYCFEECEYNEGFTLQSPCENCSNPCTSECSYFEATGHEEEINEEEEVEGEVENPSLPDPIPVEVTPDAVHSNITE